MEVIKQADRDSFISLAPHQGISLSPAQPLNPMSTPKECLLKPFGLERSSLFFISVLFCVGFPEGYQGRLGFLCLLLSPCCVSKLPSQQLRAWAGALPHRQRPAGLLSAGSQLLGPPCPLPAWAFIKAGQVSFVASPGNFMIPGRALIWRVHRPPTIFFN